MDNCEKLLRAFIEAQGYEIEEMHNEEPDKEMIDKGWVHIADGYKVVKKNDPFEISSEPKAMPPSYIEGSAGVFDNKCPDDYKVVKKDKTSVQHLGPIECFINNRGYTSGDLVTHLGTVYESLIGSYVDINYENVDVSSAWREYYFIGIKATTIQEVGDL